MRQIRAYKWGQPPLTSLAESGLVPATNTPAEFSDYLRADIEKWARVIREANIRVQ